MTEKTDVNDLAAFRGISLFQRVLFFVLLGLLAVSGTQILYAERLLESAMMDQVKLRAAVFLRGIDRQLRDLPPGAGDIMRQILLEAKATDPEELGFAIESIYVFDREGRILAHTRPGDHPDKSMLNTHYGAVVAGGKPYLGADIEYAGADRRPKTDVIIPLRRGDEVYGGLEVEIDVQRTEAYIKALDNAYERDVMLMVAAASSLMMLIFWWVLKRGLVDPIIRLASTTQRIAEGDLEARADRISNDEVGSLGRSVNKMADSIQRLFDEQEQAYLGMMQALAKALEAKDAYTAGHSGRVAHYSVLLGRRYGLTEEQIELLKQGALVHDLGKIGIPDAILNKASALTDEEYEMMKAHPEYTAAIMRPLKRFKEFTEIARWHHERWDGNGYPDGLQADQIPLLARIVAVADTWDAMTGDRVYRKGMPVEKALSILERERDSGQWDPQLVDLFVAMIRQGQRARAQVAGDMEVVPAAS